MTYCVGLLLNSGMVLLSDTRTNAGLDNIATYRKMFVFERRGDRVITLMTSGSLSISQTTIARLKEAAEGPDASPHTSILEASSLLKVAEMVGATLSQVSAEIQQKLAVLGHSASATLLLAGQLKGGPMRMFLIYPEGNFIEATEDTPFLQIGEHKYGKPILDRLITPDISLEDAQKAVLLSMDSTLRSNLSVGMPLDLCVIKDGELGVSLMRRIEAGDPDFHGMSEAWSLALRESFQKIGF